MHPDYPPQPATFRENAAFVIWMILALVLMCLLPACANVSATRFEYVSGDGSLAIEVPKELDATDFSVDINARQGTASVRAKRWKSRNVETIKAQGTREKKVLDGAADIIEKAVEGGVKAGMKGLVPIP